MFKRFVSYYKPHIALFSADMIASVLISLLGMIYPVMTNRMLNDYIPNKQYRAIIIAGFSVLALYIARMLLRYFVQYQGHMVGTRMQKQMRTELFTHLEKLPFSFFDDHETGAIMTRMTNDLFEVVELAHHGPENLLTSSIMIVLSFIYLCTINFRLTLIIFACVPFLIIVSAHYRKRMRDAFAERRKS
ncbi:MAG: ABC transporter ATP-binding protein, partial [Eubacterium sp.]|nr:ABC transporter ATP-binding protein [Eubacterium sp.]